MWELKRFDVKQFAKVYAVLMAVMGFILGVIYFLIGLLAASVGNGGPEATVLAGFGAAGIIILPILYGVFGFILGAFSAFLFNAVAKRFGGIKMEFKK